MRGQGWAAPPPGYQLQAEVLSLSQPPKTHGHSSQTTKHRGVRKKPIKVVVVVVVVVGGGGGGL